MVWKLLEVVFVPGAKSNAVVSVVEDDLFPKPLTSVEVVVAAVWTVS